VYYEVQIIALQYQIK